MYIVYDGIKPSTDSGKSLVDARIFVNSTRIVAEICSTVSFQIWRRNSGVMEVIYIHSNLIIYKKV